MKSFTTPAVVALLASSSSAFKIGFIGDTGAEDSGANGFSATAAFEMMYQQDVQLVVHNGDLDYKANARMWDDFVYNNVLIKGMDILAESGNHEEQIWYGATWYGSSGHKALSEKRIPDSPLLAGNCFGEYGERYFCEFGDILVVMIGWHQTESSDGIEESATFLKSVLENTDKKFKFCTWHQPEGKMNPGSKHTGNYELHPLYELCRQHSAVITTGHCHVYGRTNVISSFLPSGTEPKDNPDPVLKSNSNPADMELGCGETISVVTGMGGFKFDGDGEFASKPWFVSTYSSANSGDRAGALICDIPENTSGDATIDCEFRLSTNVVLDQFSMTIKEETFGGNCDAVNPTPPPIDSDDDCFLWVFC